MLESLPTPTVVAGKDNRSRPLDVSSERERERTGLASTASETFDHVFFLGTEERGITMPPSLLSGAVESQSLSSERERSRTGLGSIALEVFDHVFHRVTEKHR